MNEHRCALSARGAQYLHMCYTIGGGKRFSRLVTMAGNITFDSIFTDRYSKSMKLYNVDRLKIERFGSGVGICVSHVTKICRN